MFRGMFALIGFWLLAASSGCRMCQSPYDYCGPMFGNRCGEDCLCFERVGSAIQGPSLYEYRGGNGTGEEGEFIGDGDAEQVIPGPDGEGDQREDLRPMPEEPQRRPGASPQGPRRMNDNARQPQHRTRQG